MSQPVITDQPRVAAAPLGEMFPAPSMEAWRSAVEKDLAGAPFEKKLVWRTPEGIAVNPLYRREDIADLPHLNSDPGAAPYVRGCEALSGVLPPWQIRQDVLLASPAEANAAIRDGLARGGTAVGIRLDNAARRGMDGDEARAADLVGRGGMAATSVNGIRVALQDVNLAEHPVSFRTGSAAFPVLAMHIAVALERGVDPRVLTGSVECDPVRELVKSGHVRGGSLAMRFREMAEMVDWCALHAPGIRPVVVNSHPWHNAGASATQELAATLATGVEYMRRLNGHGTKPGTAAMGMMFSFSVSTNLYMEIAKLRAARMLWARISKLMGAEDPAAHRMFLHARTSAMTKSRVDPYNNIVRAAVEGFAAGLGGCDSLYIAPFDEVAGRPDDFSMRVARNQHLLLQEEAHLARVVDAAGGSYLIESLTDSLARAAWAEFQRIESDGGIVASLKSGRIQETVLATAKERLSAVAARRAPVVGVSNYADPAEKPLPTSHIPRAEFVEERRHRLALLRGTRPAREVAALLGELTESLSQNVVGGAFAVALKAAECGATIGEICAALDAAAKGDEAIAVKPLPAIRLSEGYEMLRARVATRGAGVPRVLLLTFGPAGMRRARADFSHSAFAAAGFSITESSPAADSTKAVASIREAHPDVVVACSDDDSYMDFTKRLMAELGPATTRPLVYIAGNPPTAEALRAAGVDGFVHVRSNILTEMTALLDRLDTRQETVS